MSLATLTVSYDAAIRSQRKAQAEFDNALPDHRARTKTTLARTTFLVAKAAQGLHSALDDGLNATPNPMGRPPRPPHPPRGPYVRPTTVAEDDMLNQILRGDFGVAKRVRSRPS